MTSTTALPRSSSRPRPSAPPLLERRAQSAFITTLHLPRARSTSVDGQQHQQRSLLPNIPNSALGSPSHVAAESEPRDLTIERALCQRNFEDIIGQAPSPFKGLLTEVKDAYAEYFNFMDSFLRGDDDDDDMAEEPDEAQDTTYAEVAKRVEEMETRVKTLQHQNDRIKVQIEREAAATPAWKPPPLARLSLNSDASEGGLSADIEALHNEIVETVAQIEAITQRRRVLCQPAAVAVWLMDSVVEVEPTVLELREQRELLAKDIAELEERLEQVLQHTTPSPDAAAILADIDGLRAQLAALHAEST